jgi:hypothetical protein
VECVALAHALVQGVHRVGRGHALRRVADQMPKRIIRQRVRYAGRIRVRGDVAGGIVAERTAQPLLDSPQS